MKISPAIYESMKADISTLCDKLGIHSAGEKPMQTMHALLDNVSRNRAFDDSHPAFASGRWVRLLPFDGRDYCFFYADGCNDTHVSTALRNIQKELGL